MTSWANFGMAVPILGKSEINSRLVKGLIKTLAAATLRTAIRCELSVRRGATRFWSAFLRLGAPGLILGDKVEDQPFHQPPPGGSALSKTQNEKGR